jgi:ABC-type branched-subunit amino acid transport system substrate-binding protein
MSKPKVRSLALLVGAGMLVAACGSSGSSGSTATSGGGSSAAPKTAYTIGVDADFSGPFAFYGGVLKQAWNAVFDSVNGSGGIDGHKINVLYLDSKSTATTIVSNAKELVGDNVLLVRSDPDSDSCSEIYQVTKPASIPLQCEALGGSQLIPPEPYLYSANVPETLYIPGVYQDIVHRTNSKPKIAEMIVDVVGEQEWAARMQQEVAAKGGTIVTDQLIPPTNLTNIASQTAAVLASHPDAVLTEVPPPTTISFVKALRQGGFNGPVYSLTSDFGTFTTLKDPNFFEAWAGAPVQSASDGSGAAAFIKNLGAVGVHGELSINAGTMTQDYLSAEVIVKALRSCGGSCTASSLNSALENSVVNDPGVSLASGYGYSPSRHHPLKQYALYAWSNSASAVKQAALLTPQS